MAVVVVATACQWPSVRGGPTNDAFASDETTLSLSRQVASVFTADLGTVSDSWQTPTVSGSQIFAPTATGFAAYDLNGVAGCGGSPTTCQPLWRGDVGARVVGTGATATGTTVYVTAGPVNTSTPSLFAFDVRGESGCTGTPRVCQPLWSAAGVSWAPPVVVGSTLYAVTANGRIAAFDAKGTTGCSGSPKVCAPLWTTAFEDGANSSPVAVADGTLYQTSFSGELWAYDAGGATGCSGTPKVCRPLWAAVTGDEPSAWPTAPVVSGDRVYVSMDELDEGWERTGRTTIRGYPLDGGTDCIDQSWARVCAPTWSAVVDGSTDSDEMAAAYGTIYVQTVVGPFPTFPSQLAAIEVDDPACSPGPCDATWTAPLASAGGLASPLVANGAVYANRSGSAAALDAHGIVGCSGTPKVCTPVTVASYPDPRSTGWSISNGKLIAITNDGTNHTLRVFG